MSKNKGIINASHKVKIKPLNIIKYIYIYPFYCLNIGIHILILSVFN